MKTPKKLQEVGATSIPNFITPNNKNKIRTPKSEKLAKTPKSDKLAKTPKSELLNFPKQETPKSMIKNKLPEETPKSMKKNKQPEETPKSMKKNKQKAAQSPKQEVIQNGKKQDFKVSQFNTPQTKTDDQISNNKTPKNKLNQTKKEINSESKENISQIISNKGRNDSSNKKRPNENINLTNKKAKVESLNKQEQQTKEQSSKSTDESLSTHVVEFPADAKCYKSVAKQIVDLSHTVSLRSLIVSFKNPEEAKKKIALIKKLKVDDEPLDFQCYEDNVDPLKRVAMINSKVVDPADVHEVVNSVSYSRLVNRKGMAVGIYVYRFASAEEANEAEAKMYDVKGVKVTLRKYFVNESNTEEEITTDVQGKRKSEEKSAAPKSKKSKVEVNEEDDSEEAGDDEDESDDAEDEDENNDAEEEEEDAGEEDEDADEEDDGEEDEDDVEEDDDDEEEDDEDDDE